MSGGWIDRIVGWCFSILLATIALYCAVALIESMLPTLIVIIGIGAILVVIIRIVVYFTSRNSW